MTKCVLNTSTNKAMCLGYSGANCTDDNSCDNQCIPSKTGTKICSVPCDPLCDMQLCRSEVTGFHPTCSKDPGQTCDPNNKTQCDFNCIEVTAINSGNFVCSSQAATCSITQIPILVVDVIKCVPNDGVKCMSNSDCESNICYPVVQTSISRCSHNPISCTEPGYISALDSALSPVCVKQLGELCLQNGECLTNVCIYTDANNGENRCAVEVTCGANEVKAYKNNQMSVCLKAGGEICTQGSQICAYGCYEYRPESSSRCAASYEPICDSTRVGLIKKSDNDAGCYLLLGQNCSQKPVEDYSFACLLGVDANQLKCSSSMPTCTSEFTPVISQNTIACKLNHNEICSSSSECLSGACYPVVQQTTTRCSPSQIACPLGQSASLSSQMPLCTLNTGELCTSNQNCFSQLCIQVKNDPNQLRCAQTSSIPTCSSCGLSKICVNDLNFNGQCLNINGYIGCTQDSCANSCMQFGGDNVCSIQCTGCDLQKCKAEATGEHPKCPPNITGGGITGIVVGIFVFVFFWIFIICIAKRRKSKDQKRENPRSSGITRLQLVKIE
ncbi:Hypothetical_protein [Hexamita inflata]|uniref:Hypothetical_protein n=1 Tax=Hexamita inflata TaxID=28002 RepID=A0AA86Q162_9EUKA|nr:Hypothetical protein HINF_LOCUS36371 [Hexamita inflata]